ncbi:ABC transporter substrate-binding protein [Cohnella cellulosilytica]|uniref:ABC transporter substrate-binding protein n=1 Tax=Cohnella cellulosilytica TaxID=986710 RepID=A0ABW2FGL0_9BACL
MRRIQSTGLLALVLLLVLAACGGNNQNSVQPGSGGGSSSSGEQAASQPPAEKAELRMTWWGNQKRADLTLQVIELFEKKYPHITIASEFLAQDVFGDKIKTQMASRSEPDLIILGNDYGDYAERGILRDLTPYVGSEIQIDKFEESFINPGRYNGQLIGLNLGNNGIGMIYNQTMIENAGLQFPETMNWDELEAFGKELVAKLGKGKYAFADQSNLNEYFEYFLRQRGKAINDNGKVGFTEQDAEDWFAMWDRFRKEGIIPTAEIAAAHVELSAETSTLIEGLTAMVFRYLNQLPAFQDATQDELELGRLPTGGPGAEEGEWLHPGQFITVSANSKHPKEAAMFIDFMINDPEATKVLGSDRGISISAEAREAIKPTLTPPELKMMEYFEEVIAKAKPLPKQMPAGAWNGALTNAAQKVAFGRSTAAEAAKEVYQAAADTLK